MKGDFTRNTFDPRQHFLRVLMQQGRVQLDADFNEQVAILLHYLQALATDLIGPYGGPGDSFRVDLRREDNEKPVPFDFQISGGHYYVDGLLCESASNSYFSDQRGYDPDNKLAPGFYLVYLDVWERAISAYETEGIREVALGGPDTAMRSRLVWQVKTELLRERVSGEQIHRDWQQSWVQRWQPSNRGRLQAQARVTGDVTSFDPCTISPEARYRGAENQLYRVEIHRSSPPPVLEDEVREQPVRGQRRRSSAANDAYGPTFKWSRENGSVIFPIVDLAEHVITLGNLGRDSRFTLRSGDWVELLDDDYVLQNRAEPLLQVVEVDPVEMRVTLSAAPKYRPDLNKHALLRRWDQRAGDESKGGLRINEKTEGAALIEPGEWLTLEDGIQIRFEAGATYRSGDYWLIPARTATGDVEWPQEDGQPVPLPPHGVTHHYAPLRLININSGGDIELGEDCRYIFAPLAQPLAQ